MVKNPSAKVGDSKDVHLMPGLGRFPGVGNGKLLQYSCLENSMDRGTCGLYSSRGHKESDTTQHTPDYLDRMAGLVVCLRPRQRGVRNPKW